MKNIVVLNLCPIQHFIEIFHKNRIRTKSLICKYNHLHVGKNDANAHIFKGENRSTY